MVLIYAIYHEKFYIYNRINNKSIVCFYIIVKNLGYHPWRGTCLCHLAPWLWPSSSSLQSPWSKTASGFQHPSSERTWSLKKLLFLADIFKKAFTITLFTTPPTLSLKNQRNPSKLPRTACKGTLTETDGKMHVIFFLKIIIAMHRLFNCWMQKLP